MIRILADENVPLASVRRLQLEGIDTARVAQGAGDVEILARAAAEQRVLLTCDRDFGRLALRADAPRPAGVIYLRTTFTHPEAAAEMLLALLGRADVELLGRLTVVRADRVRQRPLPAR